MAQVKSAGKSQAKATTKITISLPDELLAWADVLAAARRLERNDVIRQALSNGLLLLQVQTMRLTAADKAVADEYAEEVGGVEGFKQRVAEALAADMAELNKIASNG